MSVATLEANAIEEVAEPLNTGETVKRERKPIDETSVGIFFDTKDEANSNPVMYESGDVVEKGWYVYKVWKTPAADDKNPPVEKFVWSRNPVEALGHFAASRGYESDLAESRKRGRQAGVAKFQSYLIALWPMLKMQSAQIGDVATLQAFCQGLLESYSLETCIEKLGEDFANYVS